MAPDTSLTLSIQTADSEPISLLRYTNAANGEPAPHPHFSYAPDRLRVTAQLPPVSPDSSERRVIQLVLPRGWLAIPSAIRLPPPAETSLSWIVYPRGAPTGFDTRIAVEMTIGTRRVGTAQESLGIEIEAHSQFDPRRHALGFTNDVAALGQVRPVWELFRRTYRLAIWPRAFFAGLYRAIVFLGDEAGRYQGGLCTGMARAALARSLGEAEERARPIEEVVILHGRQLTDRALLASARWFLFPNPNRAFRRFRGDLLRGGRSDLCFDVGVPRPLRRDIAQALTREGHTLVPYAFRQSSPERAEVLVYDPNVPADQAGSQRMTFDLRHNTYAYGRLAQLGEQATTVIAVRQPAYRRGRTALLASLANLALYPRSTGLRWKQLASAGGVALLGGLLAARGGAVISRLPQRSILNT